MQKTILAASLGFIFLSFIPALNLIQHSIKTTPRESLSVIRASELLSDTSQINLHPDKWQRRLKHDGYVLGNGKMYLIAGLGKELTRQGKSALTSRSSSLTQIAWVIGPTYPVGNLGYGWDIKPILGGDTMEWQREFISAPTSENPFWRVTAFNDQLYTTCKDVLLKEETVFIREVEIRARKTVRDTRLFLPVHADIRNSYFGMFDGKVVDAAQVAKYGKYVGPNLKPRPSIASDALKQIHEEQKALVLIGANWALWQEISTSLPDDTVYAKMFPYRAAASLVQVNGRKTSVSVHQEGFSIDIGPMKTGDNRKLYVYIVTEKGERENLVQKALKKLEVWQRKDLSQLLTSEKAKQMQSGSYLKSKSPNPFLQSVNASLEICKASKPDFGGAMAQPYMYPMYYIRDQYGVCRLFLANGDYELAYNILQFYIAKQNHDGIQNAHDLFEDWKDPTYWHPNANQKNGEHAKAEVPSYIILLAKEYYYATGNIKALAPFYDRLKYNLLIQERSKFGILPYAGDESYTNSARTAPRYKDEMADSHLLFVSAAAFMEELAKRLDRSEDAATFKKLHENARRNLFSRLWLSDKKYFAYAREANHDPLKVDKRPVFDALLRWSYLEMGDPQDTVAQGNLQAVLQNLINPIRIVPDYEWCAGMDVGYLLYALTRSQHPLTDSAAELVLKYASDQGLYSEYYKYNGTEIISDGGTLRPWESAVNGLAIMQYITGLRLNMVAKEIYLQPHLLPGTTEWETKSIQLYNEGEIKFSLKKRNNDVFFNFSRRGGSHPVRVRLEFGQFGGLLKALDSKLVQKKDQSILTAEVTLPPDNRWVTQQFHFRIISLKEKD